MAGEKVTIKGPDGTFSGYLASPASGSGPAVVVIQEIFGVNKVMRDICDWLAGEGYFALSPDLFWRIQPDVELTDKTEAEWQQAFDLMNKFDPQSGVKDIQATIDHLRGLPGSTGKVGAVGYCLGGLMAYLTACHTDADASVGYYGVNINTMLDAAAGIKKPLMLHVAGKDQFVPPEAQKAMHEGLDSNPLVTLHDYPEQDHAFAREGGEHYDAAAASSANSRTLAFFGENL